jgi:Flp pilus assembly protein TadG
VAIMIVVLLGMGAIVVDFGQLYVERRELQNGADAAALAVAQDCAGGDCRDETATARTYANDNARDGKAGIGDVCGSGPASARAPRPRPASPPRLGQGRHRHAGRQQGRLRLRPDPRP